MFKNIFDLRGSYSNFLFFLIESKANKTIMANLPTDPIHLLLSSRVKRGISDRKSLLVPKEDVGSSLS